MFINKIIFYQIKTEEFEKLKRENKKLEIEIKENNSLHSNEKSDLVQGLELKNNNLERDNTKLKGTLDASIIQFKYLFNVSYSKISVTKCLHITVHIA